MIRHSKGKMFLADERGLNETSWFRSLNIFNFGKYFNEHKHPFGGIYTFNDDVLDAGRTLRMLIDEDSYIILLPLMGAISCKDSSGNSNLIAAGQIEILSMNGGEAFEIANPFSEGLVNFLQIWIRRDKSDVEINPWLFTYGVNDCINGLIKISPGNLSSAYPFRISVGKFSGRGEAIYKSGNQKSLFVFVIDGAFEVEGRLLHARDGLALWEAEEAKMEALSNDAIILVIESLMK